MRRGISVTFGILALVAGALTVAAGASSAPRLPSGRSVLWSSSQPRRPSTARKATAPASVLVPNPGSVFTGVWSGSASEFASEVGKHAAVYGEFVTWGQSIHWAFNDAAAAHARLMLHVSTTMGYGAPQTITPLAIADGGGDGYLRSLNSLIGHYGRGVYVRLMPEMDQAN